MRSCERSASKAEAAKYWTAMGRLERAHRRAGHEIREQLEEQARTGRLDRSRGAGPCRLLASAGRRRADCLPQSRKSSPEIVSSRTSISAIPFEARA